MNYSLRWTIRDDHDMLQKVLYRFIGLLLLRGPVSLILGRRIEYIEKPPAIG